MGADERRRLVPEPDDVLSHVADATGQSLDLVGTLVRVFRDAIDDLLAQGAVVVTGELFLSFGDSPTRRALIERLENDAPVPSDVLRGDAYATARWLDLPSTVYNENPLANRPHVMRLVIEILGDRGPELTVLWEVLEAWDATFADGRKYRISSAGLEAAAEVWLVEHLPRLRLYGFPVDLAHRQYVLPSGRRPDLLCRFNDFTDQADVGDWLVIELKANRFYPAAADQLEAYISEVAAHLASGKRVHGLLITDGADHSDVEDLKAGGVAHLSLARLGYRLQLAQANLKPSARSNAGTPIKVSADLEDLAGSSPRSPSTTGGDRALFDGPEVYWTRLFWDQDGDGGHERAAAGDIWKRREARRLRYEVNWGPQSGWPAEHPTTVLKSPGTPWPEVAVCVRCDWLVRPGDLEDGMGVREAAKEHALAHPHDALLEEGVNPPRRRVRAGHERSRRLARRVQKRGADTGENEETSTQKADGADE